MNNRKIKIIAALLGLYLFSTGVSFFIFSKFLGQSVSPADIEEKRGRITVSGPKTEACPLNGQKYTVEEKQIWESRRPLTVIVENHEDARPLSGLSYADVVYEAVAEGGVTRFLAVFHCGVAAGDVLIAPVRSTRVYFVDWASEYGRFPLFAHVGGANRICSTCPGGVKPPSMSSPKTDAYTKLSTLGWRVARGNDFDTVFDSGFPLFKRNESRTGQDVLPEHTMTIQSDLAFEQAAKRGYGAEGKDGKRWDDGFISWKFVDGKPASSPQASTISFGFWSNTPLYDVAWKYDAAGNRYMRENGGKAAIDHETNEQVSAANVVVMFAQASWSVDDEKHSYYQTVGTGKALVFQNGEVIDATWSKKTGTGRTTFSDSRGREIEFVRGPIWIEVLETGSQVSY